MQLSHRYHARHMTLALSSTDSIYPTLIQVEMQLHSPTLLGRRSSAGGAQWAWPAQVVQVGNDSS